MFEWFDISQIEKQLKSTLNEAHQVLLSPDAWLQIFIIFAVFVMARWLFTPQFQRLVIKLSTINTRMTGFNQLMVSLNEFANTLMWLMLQWIAIQTYMSLGKDYYLLLPVASLLSAWLLIRIASKLLKNDTASRALSVIAWSAAILNILGLLGPTLTFFDSFALTIGDIRLSPLIVVKAGLALWLSLWFANVLSGFLDRRLEGSTTVTPAMRVLSVKLLNVGLISAAFMITFSAVGIDLTAFAVFGGALGVGLGFGLQKIFSNLVSGVILLMDRSIKPGDVISVGNTFGWINHLSARYVSVITRDGIEHLIPNETLVTDRVENWSFSDNLVRLRVPIGISYKSDVDLAMKLCVEAANDTARIVSQPESRCLMVGFGDSSVDLELRVWINDPANGRSNVISDILLGVWRRFHQQGIEIPFPQRDLHLASLDKKVVAGVTDMLRENKEP
jgi:small-conductance mechanosensitive channel